MSDADSTSDPFLSARLPEILLHNKAFVADRQYEPFRTDRFPDKKLVIVTCMDTRLTELLPKAMNIHQGDAMVIKVAGAVVAAPFGSVMRSILVAVYELGAREILVVGHHGCGMTALRPESILDKAITSGVPRDRLELLQDAGIDLHRWLAGFESEAQAVRESVAMIRRHPLVPGDVLIAGLIIDSETGKLEVVTCEEGGSGERE